MGRVAPGGSLAHSSGKASSPPLWCPLPRCESHTVGLRSCRCSSVSPSTVRDLDVRFSSSTSLPPLDDPRVPDSRVLGGGPLNLPVSPSSETTSLGALVHQLIDLCRGNQREIARLPDEVSQMRTQLASRPHAPPPVPQAPPPVPAPLVPPLPPTPPSVGGNSPLLCRHVGCSTAVSASCPVRFCQTHCTSPRCNVHRSETRQGRQCRMGCHTVVPRSCASGFCTVHCTSLRSTLHRRRQPVCSSPNCSSPPGPACVVGSCAAHCSHPQCSRGRQDPPHHPRPSGPPRSHSLTFCRVPSCNERAHPECSTSRCTLLCASPQCQFHSAPNGVGAATRCVADPRPPSQPLNFNVPTFNARHAVAL